MVIKQVSDNKLINIELFNFNAGLEKNIAFYLHLIKFKNYMIYKCSIAQY